MVPAKENPQASALLPHSACRGRRARARPMGRNAGDVHELPMAEADRSFPRGSISLLSQGRAIHGGGLRARWGRWLADTPEGRVICRRWKEWVGGQVKKYDWDIDPDDADHPTIHGLRGTGILARAEQGYEVDQIANDIGMSRQNVEHYMRFRDQMKVGADGQKRLRLVNKED